MDNACVRDAGLDRRRAGPIGSETPAEPSKLRGGDRLLDRLVHCTRELLGAARRLADAFISRGLQDLLHGTRVEPVFCKLKLLPDDFDVG